MESPRAERRTLEHVEAAAESELLRLESLRKTGLLDSPPSLAFSRVTAGVAKLLNVPIALISLVDERRQWFLSRVGLDVAETPRDIAFCRHVIEANQTIHVIDAFEDPRFKGNPLVTGEPQLRAYLGVPVHAEDGQAIGTLWALDRRARTFTPEELLALERYARYLEKLIQYQAKG